MAANPRLIYASSSGFGRDGPYRAYPAMDLTVQAMGGVMQCTGFPDGPPVKAGPAMADFFAGIHLYGAIVTALFERERTGVARRLEVSMQDSIYASLASSLGMAWSAGSDAPARAGNRHGGLAESPYNVYPTADGFIAIICVPEAPWRALTDVMEQRELATDPRFSTLAGRIAEMDLIDRLVSGWTRNQPTDALFAALMAARIPCAPVRTLTEVMNDPNMHARGSLEWIDHPEFGAVVVQRSPFRFDGVAPLPAVPSRPLGADTDTFLASIQTRLGN